MEEINISKDYEWVALDNWTNLTYKGMNVVRYRDVSRFVEKIIYEFAKTFGLEYEDAKKHFWGNNKEFKEYVIKIFAGHKSYELNSKEMLEMKKLIKVPKAQN